MKPRRPRRAIEKEVERRVDALCAAAGCKAVRFSQPRNTMQTPGIPDRRYYPDPLKPPHFGALGRAFWFEAKAPGGWQTKPQQDFQRMAEAAGEDYVLGGYREALEYLAHRGLWRLPEGVTLDDVARRP